MPNSITARSWRGPVTNLRLLCGTLQDSQLVAKRQILGGQIRRVTEEGPKQHHQNPNHTHL
jgi:hypothetical protein